MIRLISLANEKIIYFKLISCPFFKPCLSLSVKMTREGALDSATLVHISNLGVQKAQSLKTDFVSFSGADFCEKMVLNEFVLFCNGYAIFLLFNEYHLIFDGYYASLFVYNTL